MSKLITQKKFLIDVPEGKRKERIDIFLTHHIENTTRSKVQKAIESGLVVVNGIVVKLFHQDPKM
jgi:23S rRNA pseudouridine1911/1915/1917 synthase